jgi:hypothetical protein
MHQSEKCDLLTTETYFWNILLNSNVIPPDSRDLCFDFGGATLDDIASKPEMLTETLDQVSVKNTKSQDFIINKIFIFCLITNDLIRNAIDVPCTNRNTWAHFTIKLKE